MSSDCDSPGSFVSRHGKALAETLEGYGTDLDAFDKALAALWLAVIEGRTVVPHNAYLKLFQLEKSILPFDIILVDEAQDITDAMTDIVLRQPGAKIFIGDPYQQIYAWNGAVNALDKIMAQGYPARYLSQSFCCPESVAEQANMYLQILGARVPFRGTRKEAARQKSIPAFLARTNAGLFGRAHEECESGKPFHFLGGFEGYRFETLVDIADLYSGKIPEDPFLKKMKSISNLAKYVEETEDQVLRARLDIVMKYKKKTIPIYRQIKHANTDIRNAKMILSTVHKAKGQEYDTVFLADDFFDIKSSIQKHKREDPKLKQPIFIQKAELNLIYVAFTRSRRKLVCPKKLYISQDELAGIEQLKSRHRLILLD